jgi:hypothetical protein
MPGVPDAQCKRAAHIWWAPTEARQGGGDVGGSESRLADAERVLSQALRFCSLGPPVPSRAWSVTSMGRVYRIGPELRSCSTAAVPNPYGANRRMSERVIFVDRKASDGLW